MTEFTMTQADYDSIIEKITSARNTPLIMLQCGHPPSIQEVANSCWRDLGERMGFEHMTVRPHVNGNPLMFTATPSNKG